METPPPAEPITSNYPRPGLADDRTVLREIAASQKQVALCALIYIACIALGGLSAVVHFGALGDLALLLGELGLLVFMVISVVRLANALRVSAVLYAILMFVPCVSLIMLFVISQKATSRLQQAGVKVGFMGADVNAI